METMHCNVISEEQKEAASIIKKTHALLRKESYEYGAEEAWQRHLLRYDILQKYATTMRDLATKYWKNNDITGSRCRMKWIKSQCKEYFYNRGIEKYDNRELDIKLKINAEKQESSDTIVLIKNTNSDSESSSLDKLAVLDVGSCYNPLGSENTFDVTAIDLIGVPDTVLQCDFLTVEIGEEKLLSNDKTKVLQLPRNSFDVVVFSLLLEYLPCPKQRYTCCKRAYNLLKNTGILFIISPDSKHVGANAKFMKSWRYVLSKLGFMRIKYEKLPHIHCLIFRKCIYKEVALRWTNMQTISESDPLYELDNAIFIPQDFNSEACTLKDDKKDNMKVDLSDQRSEFNELPFFEM